MNHKLTLIAAVLAATVPARAADLVLASKDSPPLPIIVSADAPPRTRNAAEVMAGYIEKISGKKPLVMLGASSPAPDSAIWVGVQPEVKALFPKVDFDFKHPEEIVFAANEKHVVIAGRDRWDPKHMEAKGRLSTKTGMQQEYGTANAVYTFIRDQLGVRWLWPGEDDVLKQASISVASMEQHYHPQIRARAGLFTKLELGDHKEGPDMEWARVQRLQLDSMEIDGGHGFGHWWEKYSKTNPEFFALQPDGTRSPHPTPNNTKLCESNPQVWQQWLTEVEEQLRVDPTQRVFNVSENDGYDFGHCVCQDCLAKDHPDGEKFTFRWRGKQEERPALTDRQVVFANTLGRMLKKRFPDKELYVQLLAYGYSRPAPIAAMPDENVIIANVGNFAMRGKKERETPMKQHAEWAAKAKHIMWRPNLGNPAGLSWGMPDVPITQLAEDFRFAAETQCLGLYFDMFWYHWSTQGPLYYALAHLAWDPKADVAALMDDYYQRCYGLAAADAKAYWQLLERTRMEFVVEKPSPFRAFELPQKYTAELFAQAQAHLDSAAAKLISADEKFRRRLHFTRCGFEFAKLAVDTRAAMQQFEASKGKDEAAKARVLANWDRTVVMQKEFPPYAINWNATFHTPGATPGGKRDKRGEGLHPKSPLTPYTLKRMQAAGLE
ncbi:DUF4838 domain-containing protein [Prosthecobacter sp.]|jgi:hypothetical protein|uniref:DUF4838 domain-containing protein n=1 Tax=Prosthecobacter sp. TaxID=1965333 RepID=UPI003784F395